MSVYEWPDDQREAFEPVSERLRLHYVGGAHAGLRGEWARLIRDETATLAEISRRYARMRRDIGATFVPGTNHVNWAPIDTEDIPF